MPTFTAEECAPTTDAAEAAPKAYRVPPDEVQYYGMPHRYHCVLKGRLAPKSFAELIEPGAFDDCEALVPWDEIEVVYGRTPMEAHFVRLLVLANARKGLRGFERAAGLVERDHVVVAFYGRPVQATANWGDEPVGTKDEEKVARTGKA